MKNALLLTPVFAIFAMPVVAADLLIIDEPLTYTDAGFDWTGFYAGLAGGYSAGTVRSVGDVNGSTTDMQTRGPLAGVTLGGNTQFDAFVLGVEGDILWANLQGTSACSSAPTYDCNAKIDWMGSVRGRAGYALDDLLLFATAGLAIGGGTGTITPTFPGTTSTFSDTFVGWTAGGGVELAVSDSVSVKAEYAYYDLGHRTAPNGTLGTIQSHTVSAWGHAVKLGVNFHL